jgi:cyclophilin family peptidyl-prolyl cis-trans isomerase
VRRLLAFTLLAALASFAAGAPPEGDVTLEATLEQKSVKLGDDAIVVVTVTNHAPNPAKVPSLRLSRDSVSIRVTTASGVNAVFTRLFGTFLPNDRGSLEFRVAPAPPRTLASGESAQARIALPAVLSGDLTLVAILGDGLGHLESKPVVLDVQSRSGGPQRVAVQVETSKGSLRLDLDAAGAFASVANFWTLAKDGFFNDLPFHRVLPGVLAQTGDPRGKGTGDPGWYVPGETVASSAARGDVGFARGAHDDSAGSQWFVVADPKQVTGGYVRLGTVGDGLDVVDALAANAVDARTGRPKTPDKVISVKPLVR